MNEKNFIPLSPSVTFADIVNQSLSFQPDVPEEKLILDLIDTPWVQRLRYIYQTAHTRLVYMFAEHSRFGHSLGVAYMAVLVLKHLARTHPLQVKEWNAAVSAAALLHDVGHLAPGSHAAFKCWFPQEKDSHEEIATKILRNDEKISEILESFEEGLTEKVCLILDESDKIPPWTWQIISGRGWNADRGNWCIVDSILAGVDYGKYNVQAIISSLTLSADETLTFFENRLDAMMHFSVSRHAMYRQVYHHRVPLSADTIAQSIVQRARDIESDLFFADHVMKKVLLASSPSDLSHKDIFEMREPWWLYHLSRWSQNKDPILSDLSMRLINRELFKTIRIHENDDRDKLVKKIKSLLVQADYDPKYYMHIIRTGNTHGSEYRNSPQLLKEDGSLSSFCHEDPLYSALLDIPEKSWIVVPADVKQNLGRLR